jgi:hypothetical protein
MAERIPGARFTELPGDTHPPWRGDTASILDQVEELVTGAPRERHADRALLTVLSVDAGDADPAARDQLVAVTARPLRGRPVDGTSNAVLAAFDGPARALRCAHDLTAAAPGALGSEVSVGVHTGECALHGGEVSGTTLQIASAIAREAEPGEVLLTTAVRGLAAGSGLILEERGERALAGVPGSHRLCALVTGPDGELARAPTDPALALRAIDSLTAGERLRLTVARRAPGVGRAAARTLAAVRRRGR